MNALTWISPADPRPPLETDANASTHLAWVNAVLGLQRTLMAERTAVTLIAFGFTVAQVFQNIGGIVPPQFLVLGPHLPRNVGLIMIAAGVVGLSLFTWQYQRAIAYLGTGAFAAIAERYKTPVHQLSCFIAYAIILIGALAFASVFVSF